VKRARRALPMKSFSRHIYLYLVVLLSTMTLHLAAQTFRGGIAGTVQDSSGAAVPNAKVSLLGTETGFKREMVTTSSGDYAFQDLPLGDYSITVTYAGFQPSKVDHIAVRPGAVFSLDIKLGIASTAESVDVNANAV